MVSHASGKEGIARGVCTDEPARERFEACRPHRPKINSIAVRDREVGNGVELRRARIVKVEHEYVGPGAALERIIAEFADEGIAAQVRHRSRYLRSCR